MGAYENVADETNHYTLPGGTGVATDYRIFSIPFQLGTGVDMLTAMENVLGSYDPTHWRAFLYTGTLYREFNSSQFAFYTIKPEMGFWIITTSFNVLNTVLPVGNYTFYFAVDGNMDGETDATWLDSVEVNVE